MRRTITKATAAIGLVIAFVLGSVSLARPADAVICLGLDVVTVRVGHNGLATTSGAAVPDPSNLDPQATIYIGLPDPDPYHEICGPIISPK